MRFEKDARRRLPRRLLSLLAFQAACLAGTAVQAATLTWTGGGSLPAWEIAENWDGPWNWNEYSPTLYYGGDVALGGHDTILAYASYYAGSAQGTGTLLLDGGRLYLNPAAGPSSFGSLVLRGGISRSSYDTGNVQLTATNFVWDGGRLGSPYEYASTGSQVNLSATNALLYRGALTGSVTLKGFGVWLDGGWLDFNSGTLKVASGAVLADYAQGYHGITSTDLSRFENEGIFVKSGQGELDFAVGYWSNTGLARFEAGQVTVHSQTRYGNDWISTGRLEVAGGSLGIGAPTKLEGEVAVTGGKFSLVSHVVSAANWQIGPGGQVLFSHASHDRQFDLHAAQLRNDGLLRVEGGTLRLPQAVTGQGSIELAGARLLVEGRQSIEGSVRLSEGPAGSAYEGPAGLSFDIVSGTDFDSLTVGKDIVLDGVAEFSFADGLAAGDWTVIRAAGGVTGQFDSIRLSCLGGVVCSFDSHPGFDVALVYAADRVRLVVSAAPQVAALAAAVPEPGALAMMAAGLAFGIAVHRRRG